MSSQPPFARLVSDAMKLRGLGLRELCRRAKLDASFLSKVLAGKRNPPSEEDVLRRIAQVLETDPVELLVAAGRIPSEWRTLMSDPAALHRVSALLGAPSASRFAPRARAESAPRAAAPPVVFAPRKSFSEELL